MASVGERVGCIFAKQDEHVAFFGYGVRLPDRIPTEAVGFLADYLRENKRENPCLLLDSGEIVYGCECWWGSEAEVKRLLENKTMHLINIEDIRKQYHEESAV